MSGYKKKPIAISIIALLYFISPIGNLIAVTFFLKGTAPLEGLERFFFYAFYEGNIIIILNLIIWLTAVPLAIGLFHVKLWAWYLFIIHAVLAFIISFFDANMKVNLNYSTIINILFLIPVGIFLTAYIRTPYFNPRTRWWTQVARYKENVKIVSKDESFTTYDFSEKGAFLQNIHEEKFINGQILDIIIHIKTHEIICKARVIWDNIKLEKEPSGYGIMFLNISAEHRKVIRNFIKELKKEGRETTH